jgi:hypothetical protein
MVLILLTIALWWGTWHGYFQQDEWVGFGRVLFAQSHGWWSLIRFSGLHFTPFSIFHVAAAYKLFGLSHIAYGIYAVVLHAINVYLVYLLALRMTKEKQAAWLAGLIFLLTFTPFQAVTWYAASLSFLPSATLALLALVLFESRWWPWALVLVLVSAGFRENAIFLLPYFAVRTLWRKEPRRWTVVGGVLATGGLYAVLRFVPLLWANPLTTVAPHTSAFRFAEILSQGATFMLFHVPRLLVPTPIPLAIARFVFGPSSAFVHDAFLNLFYLGVWIVLLTFVRIKTVSAKLLLAFVFLSFAPFFLLPAPSILESRHFYLPAVGYALLFGQLVPGFGRIGKILFASLLLINVVLIRQEIGRVSALGQARAGVIGQFQTLYPQLPPKTIFYATGDHLGFQSGVGHMLMVVLHDSQDFSPLFRGYFLWSIEEEGYEESEGKGFGYFTDFPKLHAAYCEHELAPQNVFAFEATGGSISDVSDEARSKLLCSK